MRPALGGAGPAAACGLPEIGPESAYVPGGPETPPIDRLHTAGRHGGPFSPTPIGPNVYR